MQEIERLVEEAREGNLSAFGRVYEFFFERVYRYIAFRVGEPSLAEDLTQEVFVRAMEALPSYRPRGRPFGAWLFRIAHNLVVDRLRRKDTAGPPVPLEEAPPLSSPQDVEEAALASLDQERLREALERLTDLQRQVVLYRFVAGLSLRETAAAMDRTENAIKALQHSALEALRRLLLPRQEEVRR